MAAHVLDPQTCPHANTTGGAGGEPPMANYTPEVCDDCGANFPADEVPRPLYRGNAYFRVFKEANPHAYDHRQAICIGGRFFTLHGFAVLVGMPTYAPREAILERARIIARGLGLGSSIDV